MVEIRLHVKDLSGAMVMQTEIPVVGRLVWSYKHGWVGLVRMPEFAGFECDEQIGHGPWAAELSRLLVELPASISLAPDDEKQGREEAAAGRALEKLGYYKAGQFCSRPIGYADAPLRYGAYLHSQSNTLALIVTDPTAGDTSPPRGCLAHLMMALGMVLWMMFQLTFGLLYRRITGRVAGRKKKRARASVQLHRFFAGGARLSVASHPGPLGAAFDPDRDANRMHRKKLMDDQATLDTGCVARVVIATEVADLHRQMMLKSGDRPVSIVDRSAIPATIGAIYAVDRTEAITHIERALGRNLPRLAPDDQPESEWIERFFSSVETRRSAMKELAARGLFMLRFRIVDEDNRLLPPEEILKHPNFVRSFEHFLNYREVACRGVVEKAFELVSESCLNWPGISPEMDHRMLGLESVTIEHLAGDEEDVDAPWPIVLSIKVPDMEHGPMEFEVLGENFEVVR